LGKRAVGQRWPETNWDWGGRLRLTTVGGGIGRLKEPGLRHEAQVYIGKRQAMIRQHHVAESHADVRNGLGIPILIDEA